MKYNIHNIISGEILNLDGPLDCRVSNAFAEKIRREQGIEVRTLAAWGRHKHVFLANGVAIEFTHPGYTTDRGAEDCGWWPIVTDSSQLLRRNESIVIGGVRYWGPGGITRIEDARCGRRRFRLAGGDAV